jgi:serine phosphatase RsbU (regulator of sigma subunit)
MVERPIEIASAGRPHPNETVNGDACSVGWRDEHCRIAVVDGLGHGPAAAEAAQRALATLGARPDLPLVEAVGDCHEALHSTRGAALTIVDIDCASMRLSHVGVGNVEARVWSPVREQRLSPARGIVGNVLPRLQSAELDLPEDWILVIYTDGISGRFTLDVMLGEQLAALPDITASLLADWSRATDDATVVIARRREQLDAQRDQ